MIELWEAAKRANLTEDELDSLKVAPTSLVTVFWTHLLSPICFQITVFVLSQYCSLTLRIHIEETFKSSALLVTAVLTFVVYFVAKYYLCKVGKP